MTRRLATILLGSATYGFAAGSVHSWRLAACNVLKFPLLILLTGGICGVAYYVFALFVTKRLVFRDVWDVSMDTFRDVSLLLGSLGSVCFFLAMTLEQPTRLRLNEYPFYVGLNVVFIALCGTVALVRQAVSLHRKHDLTRTRAAIVTIGWLALSLFAGGQVCWYFRPYFGPRPMTHLILVQKTRPDYHGATNFYDAAFNLLDSARLPVDYWMHR